jgi:hypothetical protein
MLKMAMLEAGFFWVLFKIIKFSLRKLRNVTAKILEYKRKIPD